MPPKVSRETPANWQAWSPDRLLTQAARKLNVPLSKVQVSRLLSFLDELMRWNEKMNLIGPASASDAIVLHLTDSLAPLPFLPEHPLTYLDIGSGAGLPGLVLKIARPDWQATLVDSNRKKTSFLRQVSRLLSLEGVDILNLRLEPSPVKPPFKTFDLITVRALAPLNQIVDLAGPYLNKGGTLAAYKGPAFHTELDKAREEAAAAGLSLVRTIEFDLPFLDHERSLLFFEKTKKTFSYQS